MLLPLFTQVELTEDIPEYNLKKGTIGTIIEHYPMEKDQENGYSIEGLIPQDTVEVSESQICLINRRQEIDRNQTFIQKNAVKSTRL